MAQAQHRDRTRRKGAKEATLARKAERKGKCAGKLLFFARSGDIGGGAI